MPRPPLRPGHHGDISFSGSPGRQRARTRYRTMSGKVIQVEATGKSKAAAKARLLERVQSYAPPALEPTVKNTGNKWLALVKANGQVRPQSVETYRRALETIIVPRIGDLRMSELTTPALEDMLDEVREQTPGTYPTVANVLRQLCAYAVRRGLITLSPMATVKAREPKPTAVKALDVEGLAAVRNAVREWQNHPKHKQPLLDVVDISIATGARIGEVLALRWDAVDLDAGRLTIRATQVWIKGEGIVFQPETKESAVLHVLLAPFAVEVLRRRREAYPRAEFVFEAQGGGMVARANLDRAFRAARGEPFKWVSWKVFRKSVATAVSEASDSLTAAKALGHTSDRVTRAHYIQGANESVAPDLRAVLSALHGNSAG